MFPYAINYGMTADEYWEQDPWLFQAYLKAHRLKNEQRNQEMWLQGLYTHEALAVVLHNSFKKKSDKAAHYPKEPFPLTDKEAGEREERDRRIAEEVNKAKLGAWSDRLQLPEKGGEADADNN